MKDWRLTNQENYLQGKSLRCSRWFSRGPGWDHDHCAFCWAEFPREYVLHAGRTALDLPCLLPGFPGAVWLAPGTVKAAGGFDRHPEQKKRCPAATVSWAIQNCNIDKFIRIV